MPLLKTVAPQEVTGRVKKAYDMVLELAGVVPKPLQLNSTSAPVTDIMGRYIEYFAHHPRLNRRLLSHIRMLADNSKGMGE